MGDFEQFKLATLGRESGGNYGAMGPRLQSGMHRGSRAIGAYQLMPNTIRQVRPDLAQLDDSSLEQLLTRDNSIQEDIARRLYEDNVKRLGTDRPDIQAAAWYEGAGGPSVKKMLAGGQPSREPVMTAGKPFPSVADYIGRGGPEPPAPTDGQSMQGPLRMDAPRPQPGPSRAATLDRAGTVGGSDWDAAQRDMQARIEMSTGGRVDPSTIGAPPDAHSPFRASQQEINARIARDNPINSMQWLPKYANDHQGLQGQSREDYLAGLQQTSPGVFEESRTSYPPSALPGLMQQMSQPMADIGGEPFPPPGMIPPRTMENSPLRQQLLQELELNRAPQQLQGVDQPSAPGFGAGRLGEFQPEDAMGVPGPVGMQGGGQGYGPPDWTQNSGPPPPPQQQGVDRPHPPMEPLPPMRMALQYHPASMDGAGLFDDVQRELHRRQLEESLQQPPPQRPGEQLAMGLGRAFAAGGAAAGFDPLERAHGILSEEQKRQDAERRYQEGLRGARAGALADMLNTDSRMRQAQAQQGTVTLPDGQVVPAGMADDLTRAGWNAGQGDRYESEQRRGDERWRAEQDLRERSASRLEKDSAQRRELNDVKLTKAKQDIMNSGITGSDADKLLYKAVALVQASDNDVTLDEAIQQVMRGRSTIMGSGGQPGAGSPYAANSEKLRGAGL